MSDRNSGLVAHPLFVGLTRPPMRFGVTFTALMVNALFTMLVFVFSKDLRTLLLAVPIHGVSALLCARDARCFDLLIQWVMARAHVLFGTFPVFRASTVGPARYSRALRPGRRDGDVQVRL